MCKRDCLKIIIGSNASVDISSDTCVNIYNAEFMFWPLYAVGISTHLFWYVKSYGSSAMIHRTVIDT